MNPNIRLVRGIRRRGREREGERQRHRDTESERETDRQRETDRERESQRQRSILVKYSTNTRNTSSTLTGR